ncbi:MAG: OmpA family protein [Bdellovibrionota bacterium]
MINKKMSLSMCLFGLSVCAQAGTGYLSDRNGQEIRNRHGECWRSGAWTAGDRVDACEGMMPKTRHVDAVSNFDFNKSELKPEGKAALSKAADHKFKRKGVKEVSVVGYADPIGTPRANEKISEERAENTKKYLVSKGVAPSKIKAEGRGARLTMAGTKCEGLKDDRLVTCLKDERRVEVQAR